MGRKRGEHLRHTGAAQLHLLEHRRDGVHLAGFVQSLGEGDKCGVGVVLEQLGEVLHVKPGNLRNLRRVAVKKRDDVLHGRGTFLDVHLVLVEHGSQAHNLSLGHSGLLTYAGKARRKLHNVALCRTAALGEFVDGGAGGQHGFFETELVSFAKHLRQLADVLHGVLTEVGTESRVERVGGTDKTEDILFALNAETSGVCRQCVELFATCARLHLFEGLVELVDGLGRQPCVFAHVGHCLVHRRGRIHEVVHGTFGPVQCHRGKA